MFGLANPFYTLLRSGRPTVPVTVAGLAMSALMEPLNGMAPPPPPPPPAPVTGVVHYYLTVLRSLETL